MQITFDPDRIDWDELNTITELINRRIDKLDARDERHKQIVDDMKKNSERIKAKYQ